MSNEAINWAYKQQIRNSAMKFVLLALADMADEDNSCYPGQQKLADMTGSNVRTVRRHLKELEIGGYLRRLRRFDQFGHRTSDRYALQIGEAIPTGQNDRRSDQPAVTLTTGQTDRRSDSTSLPGDFVTPTGQSDRVSLREPTKNPQTRPRKQPPDVPRSTADPRFVEFWDIYPRRIAKPEAFKKFAAAIKSGTPAEEILAGARRFAAASKGTDEKFIPHPSTWLNQGRWTDEPGRPATTQVVSGGW